MPRAIHNECEFACTRSLELIPGIVPKRGTCMQGLRFAARGILFSTTVLITMNLYAAGAAKPAPVPTPSPRPEPEPVPVPVPRPNPAPISGEAISDIREIAKSSSCSQVSWKDRGRAPAAYIQGMALVFAKSLCRARSNEAPGNVMAQKNRNNTTYDAVTWYESTFDSKRLEIDVSGADTLRSVYTLQIGLGMRESSGKYCTGYDTTAGAQTSTSAEAGLFQTSYNSIAANSQLKTIFNEYRAGNSSCFLNVFKENVTCRAQSIVGSGVGAEFQRLAKSCPAFAAEYAAITLRTLRKHYGPINRREAEVNTSCNVMLDEVQSYVERSPSNVCSQLE
jgi:hypothetical protein